MYISTVNILEIVTDMADIASNSISHVGFRLAQLELTLTYSKCQLGRWNGVSQTILAFLLLLLSHANVFDAQSHCLKNTGH